MEAALPFIGGGAGHAVGRVIDEGANVALFPVALGKSHTLIGFGVGTLLGVRTKANEEKIRQ